MHSKLLCFLLLGIATVVVAHPTLYFVRHGEKPRNGGDGLSILGLRRAECLRDVFGAGSDYNIGYIIAQRPKKSM